MKLNLTDTEVRKVCAAVEHVVNELKDEVLPLAESTEGRAAVHDNIARWESLAAKLNAQRTARSDAAE